MLEIIKIITSGENKRLHIIGKWDKFWISLLLEGFVLTIYVVTIGALTITTEKDAVGGKAKQSQRQTERKKKILRQGKKTQTSKTAQHQEYLLYIHHLEKSGHGEKDLAIHLNDPECLW